MIPGIQITSKNWHYYENAIAIQNDSDYKVEICVIGSTGNCEDILSGKKIVFGLFSGWGNWYTSRQVAILATATNNGKTSSVQRTYYVSTGNQRSEAWIITNCDFSFRK
jgi:hypothetical protein